MSMKSIQIRTSNNSYAKYLLGFSLAPIINAAVSFFVIPVVTRLFPTEEYGIVTMFETYRALICYVVILGLNSGLTRFYLEPPGRNDGKGVLRICLIFSSCMALIVSALIILFGNFFSSKIAGTNNVWISISLAVATTSYALLTIISNYSRMEKKVLLYTAQSISLMFCSKIAYAFAAIVNPIHTYAIYVKAICFALVAVAFIFINRKVIFGKVYLGKEEVASILKFSFPFLPVLFMGELNTSLPKLLISENLGYSSVAIYGAAVSMVQIITVIQSGFNIAWVPYVYENYQKNPDKIKKGHELATFVITAAGLGLLLVQGALYLILGENYRGSQPIFGLLLCSPIFYTIAETTGLGINIAKKSHLNIITYVTAIVVNFGLSMLLMPSLGLPGAAISVAISALTMFVIKTVIGERYFKTITNYVKTFSAPILFMLAAMINLVIVNEWIRTAVIFAVFCLVSFIYKNEILIIFKVAKELIQNKYKTKKVGDTE